MNTFLKKLGGVLVKGLQIVTGLGPIISSYVPNASGTVVQVENTLDKIIQAVVYAEGVGAALNLPGPQKLTAAAPFVEQAVLTFFAAKGWKIGDEAKFKADVTRLAGVVADILNDVDHGAVETTGL